MKGPAFIGEDLNPPGMATRLTNLDMVRPGSVSYAMIQAAIRAVNVKIAPAVINDRSFIVRDDLRAIEFRGQWGTFRVSFMVAEMALDMGLSSARGHERLAYELEALMARAIDNALRDLVRTEMRAEFVRVEAAQEREWRTIEREYTELVGRVAELEKSPQWWRSFRVWLKSLGRFD